jgi:hypothetical protein
MALFQHSLLELQRHCPNLDSVRLIGPSRGFHFDKLSSWPPNLVTLELDNVVSANDWDRLVGSFGHELAYVQRLTVRNDSGFSVEHLRTLLEARTFRSARPFTDLAIISCPAINAEAIEPTLVHANVRNSLRKLELQFSGTPLKDLSNEAEVTNTCVMHLNLVSCSDVGAMSRLVAACQAVKTITLDSCSIAYSDPTVATSEQLVLPLAVVAETVESLDLENLVSVTTNSVEAQQPIQSGISLPALLSRFPNLSSLRLERCPFSQLHPSYVYQLGQTPTMKLPTYPNLRTLELGHNAVRTRIQNVTGESAAQLFRASLNPLGYLHGIQMREAHLLFLVRVLPGVRSLSLRNVYPDAVSDAIIFAISRKLPLLEHLTLDRCFMTDKSMSHLAYGVAEPTELSLDDNDHFTDFGLAQFLKKRGTRLRSLSLDSCSRLTDDSLTAIAKSCPKLHTLSVDGAHLLTDAKIIAFTKTRAGVRVRVAGSRDAMAWIQEDKELYHRIIR